MSIGTYYAVPPELVSELDAWITSKGNTIQKDVRGINPLHIVLRPGDTANVPKDF